VHPCRRILHDGSRRGIKIVDSRFHARIALELAHGVDEQHAQIVQVLIPALSRDRFHHQLHGCDPLMHHFCEALFRHERYPRESLGICPSAAEKDARAWLTKAYRPS